MSAVACLSMYDMPELRAATDRWWQGLSRHLKAAGFVDVPASLDRAGSPSELWRRSDLLLAQCCGYDLRLGAPPLPRFVATPCYDLPYCDGPRYCSVIVVPSEAPFEILPDLRGRRAVYNMEGSHSGYNALRAVVAPLAEAGCFFSSAVETGSHRNSLESLRRGEADVAAIDCITFGLLSRHLPAAIEGVRVLTSTPLVPGLPYITCPAADTARIESLRQALLEAFHDESLADVRDDLGLSGLDCACEAEYQAIDAMANEAEKFDYRQLS